MTEMHPVESSQLASVGVEGADLIIIFKRGGRYRYKNAAHHLGPIRSADSAGKYFNAHIKGNAAHPHEIATQE